VVADAEHHVGRLDVAVHEPPGVRRIQRGRNLRDDRDRALGRQRAVGADHRAQVGAVDVAHRLVEHAVVLAGVVERQHVRVIDRRGDARLALEALAQARIVRELRDDQLERHDALECHLRRAVDDTHAAAAGDGVDQVTSELGAGSQPGHDASSLVLPVPAWQPLTARWFGSVGLTAGRPREPGDCGRAQ
jgi:hypothetical protein